MPKLAGEQPPEDVLKPRYHAALLAELVGGATQEEAAARVKVSPRSVRRWMAKYGVELERARGEIVDRAVGELRRGLLTAAVTLVHLAGNASGKSADAVRVQAASAIFSAFSRLPGSSDLEQRLARLESLMATPPPVPSARGRTQVSLLGSERPPGAA
ncbi:helix-turn-helix domain-containing protein [Anaeromyxobacter paludicola]|uniref:Homeodomain-like domain-containing protein n=1 Tax=Anaeromyxobacter paludicola TaxID=2918171 RepID=A0ABN6N372_9BACT|nr:helix-turn-helix domain-containing protein [Anaeromyxobacter paludicola]BDG06985.1 hypothetical protein AMPC_00980 [Anaeromyxobacter paludicola]